MTEKPWQFQSGKPICGANKRGKPGEVCHNVSIFENGRCRLHGGKMPTGIANHNFKSGRYSKVLPARLLDRYQEQLEDGDLLALRDEIALLDARLGDLLSKIDGGESQSIWKSLQGAWRVFVQARTADDVPAMWAALDKVDELLARGGREYEVWRDVHEVIEQRRRVVESERKRLMDMQQVITADQAMVLMSAMVDAVRRHVHDREVLAAVSDELTRILTFRGSAQALPAPRGRIDG